MKYFLQKLTTEHYIIVLLLLISGVAHGYNMFHFPYYENDEGTYLSQAWSLITQGKLAPYTYWYDHAPAGWILIAIWFVLSGGFFTFGTSVNSGRVLMLLLHLLSTYLLIVIAKKISGRIEAAIIAAVIFSLSPLGIYFQRRVLLDNIMIFWILLAIWLLLKERLRLRAVLLSALSFGIAVLTKENALFFIPAFVYIVANYTHRTMRRIAIALWLSASFAVISLYFLYAFLKAEFLPPGFFGDNTKHVSLFGTLIDQMSRGTGMPFWSAQSDFFVNLSEWFKRDAFTISAGIPLTILGVVLAIKVKQLRIPAFFSALFWIFLMRGKLVNDYYIVPLIPLLALNIATVITYVSTVFDTSVRKLAHIISSSSRKPPRWTPGWMSENLAGKTIPPNLGYYAIVIPVIVVISVIFVTNPIGQYTRNESSPQAQAIDWIKHNLDEQAFIVVDNAIFLDLHERRYPGDKVFPNADWAWKVEEDPAVSHEKLQNDWKNIGYIALSHEILKQINETRFPLTKNALDNSSRIVDFPSSNNTHRNIKKYISTNGDWMSVYKRHDTQHLALLEPWQYYKKHFIHSYGQIIDPATKNTTSEGQSYAMLRAVWLNDKQTFDDIWRWTKDHMQHRLEDKLLSWLWVTDGETYKQADATAAADADTDIALSLLFAYSRWRDERYLRDATQIIHDIFEHEVARVNNTYYVTAGTSATRGDYYLVNPSYYAPYAYRIFASVDQAHPWMKLADDTYLFLARIEQQYTLPPNWLLVHKQTGEIASAAQFVDSSVANVFSYDAFRVFWRVALDAKWFETKEATLYLKRYEAFYRNALANNGKIVDTFDTRGNAASQNESVSTTTGALAVFAVSDANTAQQFFNTQIDTAYNASLHAWGDGQNYYDQNWAWFAKALVSNRLPNLWRSDTRTALLY